MPSNHDQPWGLIVPGRPGTPSEGAAQQYTRIGPHETQRIKTFDNGTCLEFGPDDPVDEFGADHPFVNQVAQIDRAIRDIRVARQRYEGPAHNDSSNDATGDEVDPFDDFRAQPAGQHVLGVVELESGKYVQVPSRYASCCTMVSVYSVSNKSAITGEGHPGDADYRFGQGGKIEDGALPSYGQHGGGRGRFKQGGNQQHQKAQYKKQRAASGQQHYERSSRQQDHASTFAGQYNATTGQGDQYYDEYYAGDVDDSSSGDYANHTAGYAGPPHDNQSSNSASGFARNSSSQQAHFARQGNNPMMNNGSFQQAGPRGPRNTRTSQRTRSGTSYHARGGSSRRGGSSSSAASSLNPRAQPHRPRGRTANQWSGASSNRHFRTEDVPQYLESVQQSLQDLRPYDAQGILADRQGNRPRLAQGDMQHGLRSSQDLLYSRFADQLYAVNRSQESNDSGGTWATAFSQPPALPRTESEVRDHRARQPPSFLDQAENTPKPQHLANTSPPTAIRAPPVFSLSEWSSADDADDFSQRSLGEPDHTAEYTNCDPFMSRFCQDPHRDGSGNGQAGGINTCGLPNPGLGYTQNIGGREFLSAARAQSQPGSSRYSSNGARLQNSDVFTEDDVQVLQRRRHDEPSRVPGTEQVGYMYGPGPAVRNTEVPDICLARSFSQVAFLNRPSAIDTAVFGQDVLGGRAARIGFSASVPGTRSGSPTPVKTSLRNVRALDTDGGSLDRLSDIWTANNSAQQGHTISRPTSGSMLMARRRLFEN